MFSGLLPAALVQKHGRFADRPLPGGLPEPAALAWGSDRHDATENCFLHDGGSWHVALAACQWVAADSGPPGR